ncbi:MAG: oligosaccharide flippase family protein [Candidatus Cloacimonetes bacterium]|nr:oligosaccharide flippase family protein [Candidatus Cloacimonadota bacterium]
MLEIFRDLIKSTFIYSLGKLSVKFAGLILLPLYLKYLSVSEFGVFGLLEITSQIVVSFFGFHLYYAYMRWYWDDELKDKQKSAFFTILTTLTISCAILVFLSYPLRMKASHLLLGNGKFSNALFLMLISAILQIISQMPLTLIRIQEKPIVFTVASIIRLLVIVVATYYFFVYTEMKLSGIFVAQIIGSTVLLVQLGVITIKNCLMKFDLHILKKMFVFGFPLAVSAIFGVILAVSDRYCLRFLTDLEVVGRYSLGFKIANILKVFIVNSIGFAITPVIFKMESHPQRDLFYSKLLKYYTLLLLLVILPLSLFGKEIISILDGQSKYSDSYTIIPIVCMGILFGMLKDTSMTGLYLKKNTKSIPIVIITIAGLNIFLNIILIKLMGYVGAAVSTLISQIVFFCVIYRKAQSTYFIDYKVKGVFLIMLIALIVLPFSYLNLFDSLTINLVVKSILMLTFPFILVMLKLVSSKELEMMKSIMRR